MARKTIPLTDTEIKTAKTTSKELTLFDGGGLELLVKPTGVKIWRFRWLSPTTGKRSVITIGNYPSITLKMARDESVKMTSLVTRGIDPRDFKQQEKNAMFLKSSNTFRKVASDYFELKKAKGFTEKTMRDFWGSLNLHVFPRLGNIAISDITAPSVISILKPMEEKGHLKQLHTVIRRINEVMIFARNTGLIKGNELVDIKEAFKTATTEHHPTIRPEELPKLMSTLALSSINKQTRLVIEWQLLTLTRPVEACTAMWEEIDLEAKTWTIPASKMKKRRDHVIPLCEQALSILEAMRPISAHRPYVFPHRTNPNKPMGADTANKSLRNNGYKRILTAHGMRALASTALNEQRFDSDVVEVALSHVNKDQVKAAYDHSQHLEQRRVMMTWWGNFVEEASKGNVMVSTGTKALRAINS